MIVEKLLSITLWWWLTFLFAYIIIAIIAWHLAYNWKTRHPEVQEGFIYFKVETPTEYANTIGPAWLLWVCGHLMDWLIVKPIKLAVQGLSVPLGALVSSVYPPRKGKV